MDASYIKLLLNSGPLVKNDPRARDILKTEITQAFLKNGVHRTMTEDAWTQEVEMCTVMLLNDISTDRMYARLRSSEIPYIFNNGIKGRLTSDKDIILTYKSIVRWIEGYMAHDEYRKAYREYLADNAPKPKRLEAPKYTEADFLGNIKESYKDFVEYKSEMKKHEEELEKAKKGLLGLVRKKNEPKTIGQVLGGLPFSCRDYGGVKAAFLIKRGYGNEGDKLESIFSTMYDGDGFPAITV